MKLLREKHFWRALIPSVIFNLKYLPFAQAKKLPILVYKMKHLSRKGKIVIESDKIYSGMIRLGFPRAATYPNTGVSWRNDGLVVFKGKCTIPNDCFVVVGKQGQLILGDDFQSNAGLKMVANCKISFGIHARVGWGCVIMDTNYHPLYDMEKGKFKRAFGPIEIGDFNWFGLQCFVMHSVQTPERCIFGARSVVTRGGQYESYCVHGGSPIRVLTRNVMRDYNNDQIRDYTYPPQKEQ